MVAKILADKGFELKRAVANQIAKGGAGGLRGATGQTRPLATKRA
jgi:hypothetical protein